MGQGCHDVCRLKVVNLTQTLGGCDQDSIVKSGGHGHEPLLDGGSTGRGAILNDFGASGSKAQGVDDGAGQPGLVIEPGTAHVGHVHMIDLGETGVLQRDHGGKSGDFT
jgi:hypothetical protein